MPPFDDLSDTISEQMLNVRNLLQRYEAYLPANREWLRKNAPRRREPVGRDLPSSRRSITSITDPVTGVVVQPVFVVTGS